jgi:holin-like protein
LTPRGVLETALGFIALGVLSFAGDLLRERLRLPVPGMVLGLLMLLVALTLLGRVPVGLRRAADVLIRHMNLFFIPAAVGAAAYAGLLRDDLGSIAAALLLGTWAALAVGALTFRAVAARTADRRR